MSFIPVWDWVEGPRRKDVDRITEHSICKSLVLLQQLQRRLTHAKGLDAHIGLSQQACWRLVSAASWTAFYLLLNGDDPASNSEFQPLAPH